MTESIFSIAVLPLICRVEYEFLTYLCSTAAAQPVNRRGPQKSVVAPRAMDDSDDDDDTVKSVRNF